MSQSRSTACEWIEHASREFERNFARRDLDALVGGYYAPDAILIADGTGRFVGHEGIRVFFTEATRQFASCSLETREVFGVGRRQVERGQVTLRPRESGRPPAVFQYVVVWIETADAAPKVLLDFFSAAAREGSAVESGAS
jgi:ketosteroid isomerase-like protein